jgi:hypothetical protein
LFQQRLVGGLDADGPHLYDFSPVGRTYEYEAYAIGQRQQASKTYLEKNFESFKDCTMEELITHAVRFDDNFKVLLLVNYLHVSIWFQFADHIMNLMYEFKFFLSPSFCDLSFQQVKAIKPALLEDEEMTCDKLSVVVIGKDCLCKELTEAENQKYIEKVKEADTSGDAEMAEAEAEA